MKISHWYGRLGNNIQQCAVGTMAAALTQSTFESDLYAHGPDCRDIQRRILNDLGYQIVARDVANGGNQFEDWWIDPQVIDNVTWGPFISHGAEARNLFIK